MVFVIGWLLSGGWGEGVAEVLHGGAGCDGSKGYKHAKDGGVSYFPDLLEDQMEGGEHGVRRRRGVRRGQSSER